MLQAVLALQTPDTVQPFNAIKPFNDLQTPDTVQHSPEDSFYRDLALQFAFTIVAIRLTSRSVHKAALCTDDKIDKTSETLHDKIDKTSETLHDKIDKTSKILQHRIRKLADAISKL